MEISARRIEIIGRYSPNNHTNVHKPYLRDYCTEVHQIFIGYNCVIAGVNALMQMAILHFVLKRQSKD